MVIAIAKPIDAWNRRGVVSKVVAWSSRPHPKAAIGVGRVVDIQRDVPFAEVGAVDARSLERRRQFASTDPPAGGMHRGKLRHRRAELLGVRIKMPLDLRHRWIAGDCHKKYSDASQGEHSDNGSHKGNGDRK